MAIIRPLRYSGIPTLTKPQVTLSIDFQNRTWALHNVHTFDDQGKIILENGQYGLCGELASHVYDRVYPIIKDTYQIILANVAESGFFLAPTATHIVLLIYNSTTHEAYLLDPSFQRYGVADDFENYYFINYSDTLGHIAAAYRDVSFPVETGTPLFIHNNFISSFSVGSADEKFDKDNFTLAVKANRRNQYSGRYIFAIRKKDGQIQIFNNEWFNHAALPDEDINKLKKTVGRWFFEIEKELAGQ